MKKYSSFLGVLVALVMIASFVVPTRLASPEPVSANPGLMEWTPVDTPDVLASFTKEIYSPINPGTLTEGGSEIVKHLVGNDGNRMYVIVSRIPSGALGNRPDLYSMLRLIRSSNGGRSWSGDIYTYLGPILNPAFDAGINPTTIVWDMAIAPDNGNIIMVAASDFATNVGAIPVNPLQRQFVLISQDAGITWENTQWPPTNYTGAQGPPAGAFISAMDISMDFSGREMLVGVRFGVTAPANLVNNLWVMKMPGYTGWNVQNAAGMPASVLPFAPA